MEMKRINVDIVIELWKKVGSFAAEQGTTRKDIVNAALIEFFHKREK